MMEKVDEFKAVSDDGRVFIIYEYRDVINASSGDYPHATIPGLGVLRTSNGKIVTDKENGIYEIVEWGMKLRRID